MEYIDSTREYFTIFFREAARQKRAETFFNSVVKHGNGHFGINNIRSSRHILTITFVGGNRPSGGPRVLSVKVKQSPTTDLFLKLFKRNHGVIGNSGKTYPRVFDIPPEEHGFLGVRVAFGECRVCGKPIKPWTDNTSKMCDECVMSCNHSFIMDKNGVVCKKCQRDYDTHWADQEIFFWEAKNRMRAILARLDEDDDMKLLDLVTYIMEQRPEFRVFLWADFITFIPPEVNQRRARKQGELDCTYSLELNIMTNVRMNAERLFHRIHERVSSVRVNDVHPEEIGRAIDRMMQKSGSVEERFWLVKCISEGVRPGSGPMEAFVPYLHVSKAASKNLASVMGLDDKELTIRRALLFKQFEGIFESVLASPNITRDEDRFAYLFSRAEGMVYPDSVLFHVMAVEVVMNGAVERKELVY